IAGAGSTVQPDTMSEKARMLLGMTGNRPLTIPSRLPEVSRPQDLARLVDKLRKITGGVPVGVKLSPSGRLEDDLEVAVRADVDFISIDGGQAGTKAAAPILSDDFALPTLF